MPMLDADWAVLVQMKTISARDIELIKRAIENYLAGKKYRSILDDRLKTASGSSAAGNAEAGMPHYLSKGWLKGQNIDCKPGRDIWYAGMPLENRSGSSSGAGRRRILIEISASLEGFDMEELSRLARTKEGENQFKAKSTSGIVTALMYSPSHYDDSKQNEDKRKNKNLKNCPFVGYPVGDPGFADFEELLALEKGDGFLS